MKLKRMFEGWLELLLPCPCPPPSPPRILWAPITPSFNPLPFPFGFSLPASLPAELAVGSPSGDFHSDETKTHQSTTCSQTLSDGDELRGCKQGSEGGGSEWRWFDVTYEYLRLQWCSAATFQYFYMSGTDLCSIFIRFYVECVVFLFLNLV